MNTAAADSGLMVAAAAVADAQVAALDALHTPTAGAETDAALATCAAAVLKTRPTAGRK